MAARLQPRDILRNPTRGRVYAAIRNDPGITVAGIARAVDVRHQTVCYHVQLLQKGGYVVTRPRGNKVMHFASGAGVADADRELLFLQPGSTSVSALLAVVETPGLLKKEVASAVGVTRSCGAWHVRRLVQLGLLRVERANGRPRVFPEAERVGLFLRLRGMSAA